MDVGLVIAVLALGTGLVAVLKMPRHVFGPAADPDMKARVDAMEDEIAELRQRVTEAEERLDFTERALARADEARRLARGGS